MKIKNDAIVIRNGKKVYEFKNLILDKYLEEFAEAATKVANANSTYHQKVLKYCLLKFEDNIEFNAQSVLQNSDFDIGYMDDNLFTQIANERQVTIQYNYAFNKETFIYDYNKRTGGYDLIKTYYGKKITAIAFSDWWTPTTGDFFVPVKAVLDVSKYNFYLQENQDFSVTRKDIISTDALFWSNTPKIQYPVHLAPNNIENILEKELSEHEYWGNVAYPAIYSVGLSNDISYMLEEHVIGKDVYAKVNKNKLIIENIPNLESVAVTYLADFLPFKLTRSNYKYIVVKYKIWQVLYDKSGADITNKYIDTGYYYHTAIPIKETGNKNLIISYERS